LCHHSDWLIRIRDGTPEFIPPKWLDKTQTARQNKWSHPTPGRVNMLTSGSPLATAALRAAARN
jgi:hypothetical protein